MSALKKHTRLRYFLIFTLAFGMVTPIQQSCAMEQEQREDYQSPQVEITEVQGNTAERLELTPDYILHLPPNLSNLFTDNNNSLYDLVSRTWMRLMWGIIGYGVVTNPEVHTFCLNILPYLPVATCLTVGGLYALHPYAEKWMQEKKAQKEEQRKREWEEIRQQIQADSDAQYIKIRAETNEMFKHLKAEEDGI